MSKTNVLLPIGGALTGAYTYSTIGGIGLVGSFGGVGLGLGAMTGVGAIAGTALYGGLRAIETGDKTAYLTTGLGVIGGVSLYSSIGGVGLGFGGTAFGLGMGTMALYGGVLGLGIYGLVKIFDDTSSNHNYYENSFFLEKITQEYQEEKIWSHLETENEFNELKQKLKDKIDYKNLINKRNLRAKIDDLQKKRSLLMEELKITLSSIKKIELLNLIDKLEEEIKDIKKELNKIHY